MALTIELTEEEREWLKENCDSMSYVELEDILGVRDQIIRRELALMGIVKQKTTKQNRVSDFIGSARELASANDKEQDYCIFKKSIDDVRYKCNTGRILGCKVLKMYQDKVLLKTKAGHKTCLTYTEIAMKVAKTHEYTRKSKSVQKG